MAHSPFLRRTSTRSHRVSAHFLVAAFSAAAFVLALVLAILATATRAHAAPLSSSASSGTKVTASSTKQLTEEQKILHALNRLGFGPRPGDAEAVKKVGITRWIEAQLSPQTINDSAIETQLRPFKTLGYSNSQLWSAYSVSKNLRQIRNDERKKAQAEKNGEKFESNRTMNEKRQRVLDEGERAGFNAQTDLQIVGEMQAAKLLRASESKRQLQEVLVDFWSNHFNLDINKQQVQTLRLADERDAIRPHVFSKFRTMLGASAHSPAMMIYLDNWRSVGERDVMPDRRNNRPNTIMNARRKARLLRQQRLKATETLPMTAELGDESDAMLSMAKTPDATPVPAATPALARPRRGLNENYARELMELHTLGVGGGYTQKDVQEVARCFTGWSVNQQGEFQFYSARHDNSEKIVLGNKIAAGGGQNDGERVLDILAKHPATARFISRKLAMRFVSDNPPAALVERAAQAFLRTDGDLRAVTKTIVTSPEFFAPQNYRAKIKSPLEYAVSSVRALDAHFIAADAEQPLERVMLIADTAAIARPNQVRKANPNKTIGRQIAQMGQPLYAFQAPTGYSENSSKWVSSGALIARLNFALDLTNGRLYDVEVSRDNLFRNVSLEDQDAMLNRLIATTLHGEISVSTRKTLTAQLPADSPFDAAKAGALLLGSPEFQRR